MLTLVQELSDSAETNFVWTSEKIVSVVPLILSSSYHFPSFSKTVKEEIIRKNLHKKESRALLQGLFLSAGSLIISNGRLSFSISSDSEEVINHTRQKLIEVFGEIDVQIAKLVKNFKNKERYELSVVADENDRILKELGILQEDEEGEPHISDVCDKSFLKTNDTMLAFLTGVFLGTGTVSVPTESSEKRRYGYHFEIDFVSKEQADIVLEIFSILRMKSCSYEISLFEYAAGTIVKPTEYVTHAIV